jgi:glucose-6-phosphate 1-dehydrogenase
VDISWLETLTLEGRASYYDGAGALKDMIQNHLMEVMALVLMEQPARVDRDSFRGARVEALRAVATPSTEQIHTRTVRARYTAGSIGSRHVPSYVDEPGVQPTRDTETYASLTLEVDSPRWKGVPVTLRSGKALATDSADVALHFRSVPRYLRDQWAGVEPNVLRLGLRQPYVRLATNLNGPDQRAETHQLDLHSAASRRSAYANLILDMLRRDPTLLIRDDEAEEAWRIVDPVMKAWSAAEVPMLQYVAGTAPGQELA